MKVIKKICVSLLTLLLLCGSISQPTWAAEASTPPPPTPVPENGISEIGQPPELTEPEVTIPPATVDDGMPHGLIMLTQNHRRGMLTSVNPDTVLQIYEIDPNTGAQNLWSQFKAPSPEIAIGYPLDANAHSQFNADYTLLAANKPKASIGRYGEDTNHAGWIDQDGVFFDVSTMLGFDYTQAVGFDDAGNNFYFYAFIEYVGYNGKTNIKTMLYRGTTEGIKRGEYEEMRRIADSGPGGSTIQRGHCRYGYSEELFGGVILDICANWELPATDYAEPSKTIFIADYFPRSEHPEDRLFSIKGYTSVLFDSPTGSIIHYLPDSYNADDKSEWGGVLSPDGTTVAYLTVPGIKGKVSMEFVDIGQFLASGLNPASRGTPVKKELATGPIQASEWHVFEYRCDEPSCVFLDWRP